MRRRIRCGKGTGSGTKKSGMHRVSTRRSEEPIQGIYVPKKLRSRSGSECRRSIKDCQIRGAAREVNIAEQVGPGEILYKRILETWKPPRNVRPKLPCVLRIMVGKGMLETKPEVISSSGSSAFDMSARRALLGIKFPQELWNRAITIHFS